MSERNSRYGAYVFVKIELVELFDRLAVQLGREVTEPRRQRPPGLELRVGLEVVARCRRGCGVCVVQLLGLTLVANPPLDLRQRLLGEDTKTAPHSSGLAASLRLDSKLLGLVSMPESWGPVYKISYDNLTITLR